jgi:uncharacterized protein YbjQ (UPF0145 family)
MIITTTPAIEGKKIVEYKGIVFGEVISGVNMVKDMMAGLTNIFGGRSNTYETELINARQNALREMEERAAQLGANAVVGGAPETAEDPDQWGIAVLGPRTRISEGEKVAPKTMLDKHHGEEAAR